MFDHFDHTADLGLRVRAATLEQLLAEAGRGLLAMIVANPEAVHGVQSKTIELTADDPAYLLFDWLSELLFAFESEKLLLSEFQIALVNDQSDAPLRLRAYCRGEPADPCRHVLDHEVKAITYHGLVCEHRGDEWLAEVIVDI
jgi:SHS2 domain-containing protein